MIVQSGVVHHEVYFETEWRVAQQEAISRWQRMASQPDSFSADERHQYLAWLLAYESQQVRQALVKLGEFPNTPLALIVKCYSAAEGVHARWWDGKTAREHCVQYGDHGVRMLELLAFSEWLAVRDTGKLSRKALSQYVSLISRFMREVGAPRELAVALGTFYRSFVNLGAGGIIYQFGYAVTRALAENGDVYGQDPEDIIGLAEEMYAGVSMRGGLVGQVASLTKIVFASRRHLHVPYWIMPTNYRLPHPFFAFLFGDTPPPPDLSAASKVLALSPVFWAMEEWTTQWVDAYRSQFFDTSVTDFESMVRLASSEVEDSPQMLGAVLASAAHFAIAERADETLGRAVQRVLGFYEEQKKMPSKEDMERIVRALGVEENAMRLVGGDVACIAS